MEIIIEPFTGLKWKWGDKLSESERSKSTMEDRDRDLFERRFYMDVGIMWRASCVHQGVTSGTFEQRGIMSGGGF